MFDPYKKEITIDRFRKIFTLSNKEDSNKLFSLENIENNREIYKTTRSTFNSIKLSERTSGSSNLIEEYGKICTNYKTSRLPYVSKDLNISNLSNDSQIDNHINKQKFLPIEEGLKEFEIFNNYLKDVLKYEREMERLKCQLTLSIDFNINFLFKFFKYESSNYLTTSEIKYGFNLFGVFPSLTESSMIIRKYDDSNIMKKESFIEMFSPLEKEYHKSLNSHTLSETDFRLGLENFTSQTRENISQLLLVLVESERCYEKWRIQFYKMQTFTSKYVFDKFDTYGKNYISSFDIERNAYTSKLLNNQKDIQLIFLLFDKNKDHKISYSEFCDELFPKSIDLLNRKNI